MSESATQSTPDFLWDTRTMLASPSLEVSEALESINGEHSRQLLARLRKTVRNDEKNGIRYAIFDGDGSEEYSPTDVILKLNPFANGATANMLARGEYLRRVMAGGEGVRDDEGRLLPIMMVMSSGFRGSNYHLSDKNREKVRSGDFEPIAKEVLTTAARRGFGRAGLIGFSQGASISLDVALQAEGKGFDLSGIALGDPTTNQERTLKELGTDFFETGPKERARASQEGGVLAEQLAERWYYVDFLSFALSAPHPNNLDLFKGLRHATLEPKLQKLIDSGNAEKVVVGYGSAIAKPQVMRPLLGRINDTKNILTTIEMVDSDHTWGDRLPVLGELALQALRKRPDVTLS